MKLKNNILFKSSLILCLFLISNTLATKKEVSMMEFMNSYYSSDKKANDLLEKNYSENNKQEAKEKVKAQETATDYSFAQSKENKKKHKKHKLKLKSRKNKNKVNNFRFKQGNSTSSSTPENCKAKSEIYKQVLKLNSTNDTEFEKSTEGINIEGELFISSAAFRNRERFPPVMLPNGTVAEIEVDSDMYRVNGQGCENSNCKLNFWFRLAPQLHLYYAATEKDLNVLGAISIKNMVRVGDPLSPTITQCGEAYCFEIEDTVDSNWKLCAITWKRAMKWICAIKGALEIYDATCEVKKNENVRIIEKRIKEPIIIIPLPSRHCNDGWTYQNSGRDWECECKEGFEQSPIDLPKKEDAIDSPAKPIFAYHEVSARAPYSTVDGNLVENSPLKIKIFEGALRIFHHNLGKVTTVDGAVYYAEEIIFHTPAEHKINGKRYDMEIQIVHYGQTKGDISKQLVLSFLVEKKPGVYNQFFEDIDIFSLPDAINKEKDLNNNLFIPKLFYRTDDTDVPVMKPFSFYTYQGSLTSPPCSERTIMYVASKPIKLSTTTLQLFEEALRVPDLVDKFGNIITSDWLPTSSREIQKSNGRPIFFYDHTKYCPPDPKPKKPAPKGHYEKVIQKATNYFYVNGDKPSGLPGAFVVAEHEAKGLKPEEIKAR
jgi:carbonic anhydrase